MGKRYQLNRLVQWASNSIQVSRSTKRLREIDEWIDWQPLYEIGPRIGKSGPKDGKHTNRFGG